MELVRETITYSLQLLFNHKNEDDIFQQMSWFQHALLNDRQYNAKDCINCVVFVYLFNSSKETQKDKPEANENG